MNILQMIILEFGFFCRYQVGDFSLHDRARTDRTVIRDTASRGRVGFTYTALHRFRGSVRTSVYGALAFKAKSRTARHDYLLLLYDILCIQ